LTALIPEVTALNGMKTQEVSLAMRRAIVVLPEPGGPQKTLDGTRSSAMARRKNPPAPTTAS
jgi:hypothetical protein